MHAQWGDSLLDLERVNHAPRDSVSAYPQAERLRLLRGLLDLFGRLRW